MNANTVNKVEKIRDFFDYLHASGISGFVGTMVNRLIISTLVWPPAMLFAFLIAIGFPHPFDNGSKIYLEELESYAAMPGTGKGSVISEICNDSPASQFESIKEHKPMVCKNKGYASSDIADASKSVGYIIQFIYLCFVFISFGFGLLTWKESPLALRYKTSNLIENKFNQFKDKVTNFVKEIFNRK